MSDEGDKTCPLCAEEMDLTDQQLKPCKCGYDICVWCWHHIMDMAEKDETKGRCPACRTPYNKEKIVGTASMCGRLVPEMNGEKKKGTKGRSKTSEGRKHLASVRVIQRNLVYVVGLPLNFADEDLLQHKEYFGQYGKVLKVSVSRTTTGAIQHFANNSCSVYITYSKEEDAVRCIQSVHGFVLDGRLLRACFGTTKYCHAWLRNMPCSNAECLYLHEIGSQEDSFTKDEIISAYTRVQQITGSSNSTQRRSGSVLPPPADEYCNNTASSGKPISKSGVDKNNSAINSKVSPPNSGSGKSSVLPAGASWGTRASNTQQPSLESTQCSNEPVKQKLDACNGPGACSTGKILVQGEKCSFPQNKSKIEPWKKESDADMKISVSGSSLGSAHSITLPLNTRDQPATELPCNSNNIVDSALTPEGQMAGPTAAVGRRQFPSPHSDTGKMLAPNEENNISQDTGKAETSEPWIKESNADKRINVSESSFGFVHSAALPLNRQALDQPVTDLPPSKTNIVGSSVMPAMPSDKEADDASGRNIENLCSDILSMSITENQILETGSGLHVRETVTSRLTEATEMKSAEVGLVNVQPDFSLGMLNQVTQVALPVLEDDLLAFEKQRTNDPEFSVIGKPDFVHMPDLSMHSKFFSSQLYNAESSIGVGLDTHVDRIGNLINASSNILSGYPQTTHGIPEVNNVEDASLVPSKEKRLLPGSFAGEVVRGAFDTGESSIISNILSMDFDSLDEPLTSPQNLAKLLGETDKRQGHPGLSGSLKLHDSNQSRFSFAREDELFTQGSDNANSIGFLDHGFKTHVLGHDFSNRNGLQLEKHESYTNFPVVNGTGSDTFYGIHSNLSSNRLSGSRSQVSAPPGFLGPSRAPPPGFASHNRREQNLDTVSGNHMLEASSFLRNPYQAPPVDNDAASNGDIELIDPAILAVGKGMLPSSISSTGLDLGPNYSSQSSTYEEARLQSFFQRSLPQHLNQRLADFGGSNSSITDPYRIPLSNYSFSDPYRVPSDNYASLGNPYRIPSRVMNQTLPSSLSPFSQFTHPQSTTGVTNNGQWDGWNGIHSGNSLGIAEQLRAEKLGFSKFYGGYEDSKFRMPSSGNLYDRTYGI